MAPGPVPKDKSQRANRIPKARGEWRDLSPLDEPGLPELPELAHPWNARTAALWEGLRWDPATALFGKSETALAIEAAYVHAKALAETSDAMLKTCLALLDKLGLTPKGKLDLRLRVTDAPKAPLTSIAGGRARKRRGVLTES